MRTNEEMLQAVHQKVHAIEQRQINIKTAITGGVCTTLAAVLLFLFISFGGGQHRILSSNYSGASLLADDVGGYILVALAAFLAGAGIVAFLRARRKKQQRSGDEE